MKNARKIFAAFIAVLTLLVCVLPASAATNENKLIDTSKKYLSHLTATRQATPSLFIR